MRFQADRPTKHEIDEAPAPAFDMPPWTRRANDPDATTRAAAFDALRRLVLIHGTILPWQAIDAGFRQNDSKIHLASQAEGIFSPRQMSTLLSIKTVLPRTGRKLWYRDQIGSPGLTQGDQSLRYDFRGNNPDSRQNRLLRQAMELTLPIIYFFGVAPALYEAVFPVFVTGWHGKELAVDLAVSLPNTHDDLFSYPSSAEERRYSARLVRQRLHQSMFRAKVLAAYGSRCAISRLPVTSLVDAAHIIPDADPELGHPDVRNGICLSRLHHAAFDNHLLGIDPNYRIHAAKAILTIQDGPLLEHLKQLHGQDLSPPNERSCWPDKERLAIRFALFEKAQTVDLASCATD